MKALIHIGIPKSGTSSLQAFLGLNRAALQVQGVLHAPFNPAFGSQFEFPVTALEACGALIRPELERRRLGLGTRAAQANYVAHYTDFLDGLLMDAGAARCFIGSSEHCHAWLKQPEQVAALDQFLSARFSEVRYLVYLRPQDELVTSSYSEAIRRGATHEFPVHLARHARHNHWAGLKPWRAVVGSRLAVRLTSRDALQGGDLLADFCALAGIDSAGLLRPPRVNAALGAGELALRRRLNRLLPVLGRDGHLHPMYQFALCGLGGIARRDTAALVLTAQQRAQVLDQNHASNEKLRRRYFPERPALF